MKHIVLPTSDNIFVKRLEAVKQVGEIIVPEGSQDAPSEGHIVAIGPEVMTAARREHEITRYMLEHSTNVIDAGGLSATRDPADSWAYFDQTFDLGDHVMFGRFSGIDVPIDGEVYVKLRPDEIFVVLRDVPDEKEEL